MSKRKPLTDESARRTADRLWSLISERGYKGKQISIRNVKDLSMLAEYCDPLNRTEQLLFADDLYRFYRLAATPQASLSVVVAGSIKAALSNMLLPPDSTSVLVQGGRDLMQSMIDANDIRKKGDVFQTTIWTDEKTSILVYALSYEFRAGVRGEGFVGQSEEAHEWLQANQTHSVITPMHGKAVPLCSRLHFIFDREEDEVLFKLFFT